MSTTEQANAPSHYILLTVAIVIGLFGVYFRFAGDTPFYSWTSNIIMVVGAIIAFKAVFSMLK